MNGNWWRENYPAVTMAFWNLEVYNCYAVVIGKDEIRCLSEAEYDAMWEAHWQQSEGPRHLKELAGQVIEAFQADKVDDIARQREPHDN